MTCPHNMPSPGSCIECMEEGPVAPAKGWKRVGNPFVARYDAECADTVCTDWIVADKDSIQRWDMGDNQSVYTHEDCHP